MAERDARRDAGLGDRDRRAAARAARGAARLPRRARRAARRRAARARLVGRRAPRRCARVEIALAAPWSALFASRLWATAGDPRRRSPAGDDLAARDHARDRSRRAVARCSRAWTRGPIRWRLGSRTATARGRVARRARRHRRGARAGQRSDRDHLGRRRDDGEHLELVPRRLDDPRFAYRVADVPAASHPTVAAALAWVADARAGDRVWDPFCGSGVELVERARAAPSARCSARDLDDAALAAARANLAAPASPPTLAHADARTHAPGAGRSRSSPTRRSAAASSSTPRRCSSPPCPTSRARSRRGGRLVWITPAPQKTSPVAEQLGLVRASQLASTSAACAASSSAGC